MLSKLCRACIVRPSLLKILKQSNHMVVRTASRFIPPTQYDIPIPKRLKILYVLRVHWETIPLFFVTALSFTFSLLSCIWAAQHKMDVVFSTHSRNYLSRTMDLRNPSVHKLIIINQRYEPWPEMQDVLDKMALAEQG